MNAIGATILTFLLLLVLFACRRWALLGMMAGVLYLTQAQTIDVLGINFFAIRFLELAGFIRIIVRREIIFSSLNGIDRIYFFLYAYTTTVFLIRSNKGQINAIGMLVDALLVYFTFRALIRNIDDFKWFLGVFVFLLFPFVALVSVEMLTHENPFTLIGGSIWSERDGRLRCMGSFRNPSLLGTLGAAFLPLYIALLFEKKNRICAIFGIVFCLAIVYLSNSGGPLTASVIGVVGWLFWFARKRMFFVRYILVCSIFLLGSIMKAPLWYLPAKISSYSGGAGYHRSYLMDLAFQNISLWWFVGMDTHLTRNWFPYILVTTDSADIANQYLVFGFNAGLLALALFIFLLVRTFLNLGRTLTFVRSTNLLTPTENEFILWGLGCIILVHIFTWVGISYFDQTQWIWLMQLAAISSISNSYIEANLKQPNKS